MTTTPGNYDFTIYQGATFSRILTWKSEDEDPIDLTGYAARMMLRDGIDASAPFLTLTTENGSITLGGALGTITLAITTAATAALTQDGGNYDLELVSGSGTVSRLLQGSVIISKEITR